MSADIRDHDQDIITNSMTISIIQLFEVVDIDQNYAERCLQAFSLQNGLLCPLKKITAVANAR